jgi:hypothetical protein
MPRGTAFFHTTGEKSGLAVRGRLGESGPRRTWRTTRPKGRRRVPQRARPNRRNRRRAMRARSTPRAASLCPPARHLAGSDDAELLAGYHGAAVFDAHDRSVEGARDSGPAAGALSAHEGHVPPKVTSGFWARSASTALSSRPPSCSSSTTCSCASFPPTPATNSRRR